MVETIEDVIHIREVERIESGKHNLRIHMRKHGKRPVAVQLSADSVKRLARMLEPVLNDGNLSAERGRRLVKLARLKETYGAYLVVDLLSRYPEYDLDELERDLSRFSYR